MTVTPIDQSALTEALQSFFVQEIVRQIRGQDSYNFYQNWADELLIKPFIISRKDKAKIPLEDDIDPRVKSRIFSFYRAVAACIESQTGKISQVVVDINHEGFGWVLVFSGRLLLVKSTLRDAQRFGFDTAEKLIAEGEKLVTKGVDLVHLYGEVCDR